MVNIRNNEQFSPEFVKICPNSKIPAIVDQDGPAASRWRCSSRRDPDLSRRQDRPPDRPDAAAATA
jgi:hypothetical protein